MQVIQIMAVVETINDGPTAYWWVSIETLRYTSTTVYTAKLAGCACHACSPAMAYIGHT